ncbi:MAG: hypothetical protein RIF41_10405 [Polyangiaceae bacterium]
MRSPRRLLFTGVLWLGGTTACSPSPAATVQAPATAANAPSPSAILAACAGAAPGARCAVEEPYGTRFGVCVGGDDGLPASCQAYQEPR